MYWHLDDVQAQINKYLLKTVCSDITNLAFNAVATEEMISLGEETIMSPEVSGFRLLYLILVHFIAILVRMNLSI